MRNGNWRKFLAQSASLVWVVAIVGQRGGGGGDERGS